MGEHKFVFWFSVIVGPLLGGFAAYWVAASVLGEYSWCIAGEEHCVREWVSALSGWAAAAAAGITLFALYDQLIEQRKQTAFSLGDANPTADALESDEELFQVVIQVVNWNRRTLLIEAVRSVGDVPLNLTVERLVVAGVDVTPNDIGSTTFTPQLRLEGWIDRSKPPATAQMTLRVTKVHRKYDGKDIVAEFVDTKFDIDVLLVGDRHENRKLHVSAPVSTF